jgi:chromosomal replication initiator protein
MAPCTNYPCELPMKKKMIFLPPQAIILRTCIFYDKPLERLESKSRKRIYVIPRQIAMYFLKMFTSLSLEEIGNMFGERDHSTAIHSINTVKDLIDTDEDYRQKIKELEEILRG